MAANKQRGEVDIRLGKQTRTLRFRSAQIAMLEDRMKLGISQVLDEEHIGIRTLAEAIFVGLSHTKKVTPAKVYSWLDQLEDEGQDLGDLMVTVFEALASGLPGLKDSDDADEDPTEAEGE